MRFPIRTRWGWLNFLLVQWFFFRIVRVEDECGKLKAVGILRWVWPLTGWWSNYRWLKQMDPWFPGYKRAEGD